MRSRRDGEGARAARVAAWVWEREGGGLERRSSVLYWSEAGSGGHSWELHSSAGSESEWTFKLCESCFCHLYRGSMTVLHAPRRGFGR